MFSKCLGKKKLKERKKCRKEKKDLGIRECEQGAVLNSNFRTLAGDSADCESGDTLLRHNKNNSSAPDA